MAETTKPTELPVCEWCENRLPAEQKQAIGYFMTQALCAEHRDEFCRLHAAFNCKR